MRTPILFQLVDEEGLFALETFAALRENDVPVELRIFPDEHHIKWQPAHRAEVYARNLDWFRFWLRGEEDPDPAKREQYRRCGDEGELVDAFPAPGLDPWAGPPVNCGPVDRRCTCALL